MFVESVGKEADLHDGGGEAHSILSHHESDLTIRLELEVARPGHHTLHLLQHSPARGESPSHATQSQPPSTYLRKERANIHRAWAPHAAQLTYCWLVEEHPQGNQLILDMQNACAGVAASPRSSFIYDMAAECMLPDYDRVLYAET